MIMYENLIMGGGEITSQGTFKADSGAFYLFVVPKSESAASIAVLNVKLSRNKQNTDYPFVAGMWNPVVVNSVDVKSTDLQNYRIFYGETL